MKAPVTTLPYMASGAFYQALAEGIVPEAGMPNRTLIRRPGGEPLLLSVPLVGGSGVLKRHGANPLISDHGRWTATHIGALEAAYSREPFFGHIFDRLRPLILSAPGRPLADLTADIHSLACRIAGLPEMIAEMNRLRSESPETAEALRNELSKNFNPEISFFDILFRVGPSVIFCL